MTDHTPDDYVGLLRANDARIRELEAKLRNLLARIHRDGGQYTDRVGMEQSCVDADAKVAQAYGRAEEAERESASYRDATIACVARLEADLEALGKLGDAMHHILERLVRRVRDPHAVMPVTREWLHDIKADEKLGAWLAKREGR